MTPEDVRERMQLFLSLMREEQELRDRLLTLDLTAGTEDQVREALAEQQSIFTAIETLRQEKMIPLLAAVAKFTADARADFEKLPPEVQRDLIQKMGAAQPAKPGAKGPTRSAQPARAKAANTSPSLAAPGAGPSVATAPKVAPAASAPKVAPAASAPKVVHAAPAGEAPPPPSKLKRAPRAAPRGDASGPRKR